MNDSPFYQRLRAAIENRDALEALDGEGGPFDPADEREWQRQIRLDAAIRAWKRGGGRNRVRPASRLRQGRWALASIALGLAFVGFALNFDVGNFDDRNQTRVVQSDFPVVESFERAETAERAVVAPLPVRQAEPTPLAVAHFAPAAELESRTPEERYAEFSQTADRLAYAFEPVGQRVTAVVQRLIDAVPGADMLTNWQYGT